jgi:hypothetical protein
MIHNRLQVDYSAHKMTLAISMLKNIFLLHTIMYTHDICHSYTQEYLSLAY